MVSAVEPSSEGRREVRKTGILLRHHNGQRGTIDLKNQEPTETTYARGRLKEAARKSGMASWTRGGWVRRELYIQKGFDGAEKTFHVKSHA